MNSTTGAELTALSIAALVSVDRKDFWRAANLEERRGFRRGRRAAPVAYTGSATSRSDTIIPVVPLRVLIERTYWDVYVYRCRCSYSGLVVKLEMSGCE